MCKADAIRRLYVPPMNKPNKESRKEMLRRLERELVDAALLYVEAEAKLFPLNERLSFAVWELRAGRLVRSREARRTRGT